MKRRTEEEWRCLHENAICAVIAGKCANIHFASFSWDSIAFDAICLANTLVKKLKDEEKESENNKS
jgi:hypothetical protein